MSPVWSVALVFKLIFQTVFIHKAHSMQCLECQELPRPDDCRITTTCSGNSMCYVTQVVTSGGLILYNSGCASATICSIKRSSVSHDIVRRQDQVSKTDVVTCMECCDDDFCNIEGCGIIGSKPPQRPPICFTCQNQLDPMSCRDATLCDQDHMCALQQTNDDWKSECLSSLQCKTLEKLSLNNVAGPCYACCNDDFCNNVCIHHAIAASTSLPPTVKTTRYTTDVVTSALNPTHIVTPTKQLSTTMTLSNINSTYTVTKVFSSSTIRSTTKTIASSSFSEPPASATSPTQPSLTTNTLPSVSKTSTLPPASATSPWKQFSTTVVEALSSSISAGSLPISTSTGTLLSRASAGALTSSTHATFQSSSTSAGSEISYVSSTERLSSSNANTSSMKESPTSTKTTPHYIVVSLTKDTSSLIVTKEPSSTMQTPLSIEGCNNKMLDICFIVDSSGSVGPIGLDKELNFVKSMITTLASNTTVNAEFCVITYSTKAHVYIKLHHYNTAAEVIHAIDNIPYITGESYSHLAIHLAHGQFSKYARHHAKLVTILIANGPSTDPDRTIHQTQHFLNNVDKYAVGIGPQTNSSELPQFVSGKDHLFDVQDISQLDGMEMNLLQTMCSTT